MLSSPAEIGHRHVDGVGERQLQQRWQAAVAVPLSDSVERCSYGPTGVADPLRGVGPAGDACVGSQLPLTVFSLATAYLDGVFPIRYETTNAVAQAIAIAQVYGLGDDYYTRYRERIRAVTADDVLRAAQNFLHPDQLLIFAVGNEEAIRGPLEKLNAGAVSVHEAPAEDGSPV